MRSFEIATKCVSFFVARCVPAVHVGGDECDAHFDNF